MLIRLCSKCLMHLSNSGVWLKLPIQTSLSISQSVRATFTMRRALQLPLATSISLRKLMIPEQIGQWDLLYSPRKFKSMAT